MQIVQKDVIKVVGCLHLSTGQEARSEAAVRAMQKIFDNNKTEGTQLIDVENALSTYIEKYYLTTLNVEVQNQLRLFTIVA